MHLFPAVASRDSGSTTTLVDGSFSIEGLRSDVGHALRVEARDYRSRDMGLRWKLTLLMADVGNVFYAVRKLPVV